MTFYEIAAMTAGVFHLLLTVFVFSRDLSAKINRTYLVWGAALTVWNFSTFLKYRYQDTPSVSHFWLYLLHFSLIWLPVGILHLCLLISQLHRPRVLAVAYAVTVTLAISIFIPGLYVRDFVEGQPGGYGPTVQGGGAFKLYTLLYVCVAVYTITLLYRKQRQLSLLYRRRILALLLGYATLVLAGANDLMFITRDHYPGTRIDIIPLGNMAAIFYGIVVAYSVLQHQLLDVNVALSRFAAQFVRIAMMTFIGVFLLAGAALFDPVETGIYPYFAASMVILLTSILASLLFPKLLGKGDEVLERKLLGDSFEYHDQVRSAIRKIREQHEPTSLLAELQTLLVQTIRVSSYQIILLDENTRGFSLFDSYPMQTGANLPSLNIESPVFRYFKISGASYLTCKAAYAMPGETELEREARHQLDDFAPELCFPFVSGEDPFGLLLLGAKTTGDPFTSSDLHLLNDLVYNLRLVLDQIRLKNQIHMAQEQEMLGRMSRGLAHDLNNLLTPVQTCLQLIQSGVTDPATLDEILPMSTRNIDTVRAYVNEALFFSRTHSLKVDRCSLVSTVRETANLLRAEIQRKQIQLKIEVGRQAAIDMDEVLIKRLISNLLNNAIDATPNGNEIKIEVQMLPKTERHRDWYRLQIKDSGTGISAENLKRVFMPYFSTKNTGEKRRGFGLGLAIARKIVHLHGGNMQISSEQDRGTTVTVDLPSRQNLQPEKINARLAAEFAT